MATKINGTSARDALHRVTTSSIKGSDRTSYLTRAPFRPSSTPLSSSSLSLLLSPFLPFLPPFFSPSALLFPPSTRRLESLFIFISFGLVCRLAARHRDYRVPSTHLGNSGGPLSSYYQGDALHPQQDLLSLPLLPSTSIFLRSSSLLSCFSLPREDRVLDLSFSIRSLSLSSSFSLPLFISFVISFPSSL